MDRLDSWLNSQVGWRRVVLIWLLLCPAAVAVGGGIWSLFIANVAGRPAFSWRMSAAVWCLVAGALLGTLTDEQPYWHRIHRVVGLSQLALFIIAAALVVLAVRRHRRPAHGNASGAQGQ